MEPVDLPLACHPSPSLTTFDFRSSVVRRNVLDLEAYGGTDALDMLPLFLLLLLLVIEIESAVQGRERVITL